MGIERQPASSKQRQMWGTIVFEDLMIVDGSSNDCRTQPLSIAGTLT
jgi:hypothetical protein